MNRAKKEDHILFYEEVKKEWGKQNDCEGASNDGNDTDGDDNEET